MKKTVSVILTVLLLLSVMPAGGAVEAVGGSLPALYVSRYSAGYGGIVSGGVVPFTLYLSGSGLDAGDKVTVALDSGSAFRFIDGSVTQTCAIADTGTSSTTGEYMLDQPLQLRYDGSSRNLSLTLYDGDGNAYPQTVYVSEATPDSERTSAPQVDPKTMEPVLSVTGDVPVLEPGKPATLMLYVRNQSAYDAVNLYCTLTSNGNAVYPSAISNRFYVGNVGANATIPVSIPVMVAADAAYGYCGVSLAFEYTNSAQASFTHEETIGVSIGGAGASTGSVLLNVASAQLDRNIVGGDSAVNLAVEIQNTGSADAQNVEISLDGYSAETFTLNDSVGTRAVGTVAAGSRAAVQFPLKAASKLASGSYPMKVNISYKAGGETKTVTETVYLNITRSSSSGLVLSSARLDTSTPGKSNRVKLTLGFANKTPGAVTDVKISLKGLTTTGFTLDGTFGSKNISSIATGGEASVTLPLYVAADMLTGNYPLTVVTEYTDASGTAQTAETEIYLFVNRPENKKEGEEPQNTSTPRIIIDSYKLEEDSVNAGAPFHFDFTLKNTSDKTALKNLKIVVQSADGIFVPAQGSNSFYEDSIPAGGTLQLGLDLTVAKRDAESKSYPLQIAIDYEDSESKPYNVVESVSIPVTQEQRLEVSNLNYTPSGLSPSYLSLQYVNKGRGILYNLSISVEGPFTSENGVTYIGNLGAGSADYFEDMLTPTETGNLTGKVVFSYEDINGKTTKYEQEFTADVADFAEAASGGEMGVYPDKDMSGMEQGGQSGGLGGWALVLMIGGAVLIAGGITAIILIRRARKKKREKELVEDE